MMLNRTVIEDLLTEMEKNVALLGELQPTPKEEFVSDPRIYSLAERWLQVAVQCLLDVCYYLASKSGWDKPEDGASAILLMAEKGVLPNDFAQRIVGIANFRNILVHAYLRIDRRIVYDKLQQIEDFHTFQRHVLEYLARTASS